MFQGPGRQQRRPSLLLAPGSGEQRSVFRWQFSGTAEWKRRAPAALLARAGARLAGRATEPRERASSWASARLPAQPRPPSRRRSTDSQLGRRSGGLNTGGGGTSCGGGGVGRDPCALLAGPGSSVPALWGAGCNTAGAHSNRWAPTTFFNLVVSGLNSFVFFLECTKNVHCIETSNQCWGSGSMFLVLPDPDPVVRGTDRTPDPDPSLFS